MISPVADPGRPGGAFEGPASALSADRLREEVEAPRSGWARVSLDALLDFEARPSESDEKRPPCFGLSLDILKGRGGARSPSINGQLTRQMTVVEGMMATWTCVPGCQLERRAKDCLAYQLCRLLPVYPGRLCCPFLPLLAL